MAIDCETDFGSTALAEPGRARGASHTLASAFRVRGCTPTADSWRSSRVWRRKYKPERRGLHWHPGMIRSWEAGRGCMPVHGHVRVRVRVSGRASGEVRTRCCRVLGAAQRMGVHLV